MLILAYSGGPGQGVAISFARFIPCGDGAEFRQSGSRTKKLAKPLILRFINAEPKLTTTANRLFRRLLLPAVARACATVLLLASVAFAADLNLPSPPSISLAHGSNTTTVTYRGQTNFQFILYASSNSTAWAGLLTNFCTNPQMTFSESNRPIRFYKASSLKTPLIYQC